MKHLMQQVTIISYMETMLHTFSDFLYFFPRVKRYVEDQFNGSKKQSRFVSLAYMKNEKMISVDVEESLRERLSTHHKNTSEASEMEQKFDEFSKKLDLVMEQMAALTRANQQKPSKWAKVKEVFLEQDDDS